MKIDIIIINFKNYPLLDLQLFHWRTWMKGDFNLIVVDNTPIGERQYHPGVTHVFNADHSFDGISSGQSYDYALNLCTSDIVGMTDPDHFFLDQNILEEVQEDFANGYKVVGCQGFYPDWQRIIDTDYPDFAGHLCPVLWGQFVDRKLALEDSFICDPPGRGKISGWRLRRKVIDNKIPNKVWMGSYPFDDDNQTCAFGPPDKPKSVHLLKGSGARQHMMEKAVPRALEWGKAKWQ